MNSAVVSSVELQMLLFTSKTGRAKTDSDGAMVCCDEVTLLLARLLQIKSSPVYLLASSFFTNIAEFATHQSSTCIRLLEAATHKVFIAHQPEYFRFKNWQPLRTHRRSSHPSHPSRPPPQPKHW